MQQLISRYFLNTCKTLNTCEANHCPGDQAKQNNFSAAGCLCFGLGDH